MRRLLSGLALILTTLALVPGCSPQATSYVREDVDYSFIRTVAIFPFKNLSQDVHANDRVYSIFTSQLLAREAVEVVEYGAVLSAMAQMRLNLDSVLTPAQVIEMGKILGVNAIFFGTVEEYGVERVSRDRTYSLTCSYSLAETETGVTIWSSQTRSQGSSVWRKIFGGGSASLYSVSRKNVDNALETLF
jgi:hypothetical protein